MEQQATGLTEQPRKGQRIGWFDERGNVKHAGTVLRCEGNLCWLAFDSGVSDPFIWRFKDGLNTMATVIEGAT